MIHSTSDEWLWGVDVYFVTPCRCGCALRRVHPHSIKSNLPVWKCAWCRKRKGSVTEDQIELLEDFLHRFGWTMEPLVFYENGIVYAHCQLPALWEAESCLRRQKDNQVSALPANGDIVNDSNELPRDGGGDVGFAIRSDAAEIIRE